MVIRGMPGRPAIMGQVTTMEGRHTGRRRSRHNPDPVRISGHFHPLMGGN